MTDEKDRDAAAALVDNAALVDDIELDADMFAAMAAIREGLDLTPEVEGQLQREREEAEREEAARKAARDAERVARRNQRYQGMGGPEIFRSVAPSIRTVAPPTPVAPAAFGGEALFRGEALEGLWGREMTLKDFYGGYDMRGRMGGLGIGAVQLENLLREINVKTGVGLDKLRSAY